MRFKDALCRSKAKTMKPRSIQLDALISSTHLSRKYVRALRVATRTALRMAAWNALLIVSGVLLIALVGEAYFRLTKPFMLTERSIPYHFVDGVGLIREPNAELRYVHSKAGIWVSSRVNSQGFLDREPVSAERAADGCHITFIGDSFVEAKEVSIADKFHVRLEEMATRELPHLDITTQAYGMSNTGQIHQLPFYDEYARRLNPKLVALVFFSNDFIDGSTALYAIANGLDPDKMPYTSAQRDEHGALKLRPPDPEFRRFMIPKRIKSSYGRAWDRLIQVSYFAKWLDTKNLIQMDLQPIPTEEYEAIEAMIAQRPCCAWALGEDRYGDAMAYAAFGIEQFKRRADRDGAHLIILAATRYVGKRGDPQFDRLSAIAEPLGIPLISQYDYMVKQGHNVRDSRWRHDGHWNANGHQWAAEAVLEWLKANQDVCD